MKLHDAEACGVVRVMWIVRVRWKVKLHDAEASGVLRLHFEMAAGQKELRLTPGGEAEATTLLIL